MQLIHASAQQELWSLGAGEAAERVGVHTDRSDIELVRIGTAYLALTTIDHAVFGLAGSADETAVS